MKQKFNMSGKWQIADKKNAEVLKLSFEYIMWHIQ